MVRRLLQHHGRLGLNGVIPVLPVADVDAALQFYKGLGFSIEGRHVNESDEPIFGSVLCGGANLYLSRALEPIASNHCYIGAEEVDDLCLTFKAKGAKIVEEPEDKSWGYRQFTLEDPNGHLLVFFCFSEGE